MRTFEAALTAAVVAFGVAGPAVAGEVTGVATLAGERTPRKAVRPFVDKNVCGEEVPDESVRAAGGRLAGVVVWLDGAQGEAKPAEVVVDQRRCRFAPRVATARVGDTLVLVNSDPTLHTVHAYDGPKTRFNVATPIRGQRLVQPLDAPGVLELRCDAGHAWMRGFVHVFAHPFHAVSADDGTFTLRGVPPGKWRAKAWHEAFGTKELGEVTVEAEGSATLAAAFDAKDAK